MPVNMRDVAQAVGVSIKTVSRVINDEGGYSDATQQRVLKAIDELGFRPNLMARGLITQRSYTVGLIVVGITNPFFPEVAQGVQDAAREHGHHLFLCSSGNDPDEERNFLNSLAAQAVDGIIIFPTLNGEQSIATFAKQFRPLVVVNQIITHPNIGLVMANIQEGAVMAVDYLVDGGHTQIGMLAGATIPSDRRWREIGFKEALIKHGLPVQPTRMVSGDGSIEGGYAAAKELLSTESDITAVFAYNDLMAIGALRACQELGRRVPDDCAIVGFDDINLSGLVTPALTTIRINKYELGRQAMNQLAAMINEPAEAVSPMNLDVELVIRQSA